LPELKGFRGWRYNDRKVKLADVFAPPYDVISPKEQDTLYKKNPFNVIRLELGKEEPGDSENTNKYTRAKSFLNQWKQNSVLIQDHSPSIYVYVQNCKVEGRNETRIGFLAAMKIDEKAVLKHENTLASPKKDRLALLQQVKTNLSPIWGLFEDKKAEVNRALESTVKTLPVVDVTVDGVRHRLFVENRVDVLNKVVKAMKKKPMFIADGHHRFEVACQYRKLNRKKGDANYVMTYFADCLHNPFKIFPTHRLLRIQKPETALKIFAGRGTLKKLSNLNDVLKALSKNRLESKQKEYPFGIYTKKDGFYLFTLSRQWTDKWRKDAVKRLDVSVLHEQLIAPLFGITKIEKSQEIDFTRDAKAAVEKVDSGEFNVAIFLRPTSLVEMIEVSKKGLKMPQKSTYFYPKLLSGLVFNTLEL
jgi:uncharacterized protein (DUF1015 family)